MLYTILVEEDNFDSRDLMRVILEAEGYRDLEAPDGLVALDMAQRETAGRYPDGYPANAQRRK